VEPEQAFFGFVRRLVELGNRFRLLQQNELLQTQPQERHPYAVWHGVEPLRPDWGHWSHSLACSLCHPRAGEYLYLAFNAWSQPLTFQLPSPPQGYQWHRLVDTRLEDTQACLLPEQAPLLAESHYEVQAGSALVLAAQPTPHRG
jgi:glycogen operon protein